MKITLIKPPNVHLKKMYSAGSAIPPIGIAYLSSYLKKNAFDVHVIDAVGIGIDKFHLVNGNNYILQGLIAEEIVDLIPGDSDIIGISCMFSSEWFYYEYLIHKIGEKFPDVTIIVGGEHVTADWKNILKLCPEVNFCVIGEGEETLVELLNAINNNSSADKIPGIAFRNGAGVTQTPRRNRIANLNDLPVPDWSQVPIENYLNAGNSMSAVNKRAIPILASRGCPYKCTFCTSPQMWGTNIYYRNPKSVVAEIKGLYEKYNINHIDMIDIVGLFNVSWTKEFLNELISANLPITWLHAAGTRSEIMNEEILKLIKKSNAIRIHFSPESGSKKTLARIEKRIDLDRFITAIKSAARLGISIRTALIVGFPNQTFSEVLESIFFGAKLVWYGVDDVVVHTYSALPGSQLYQELQEEGKINVLQMQSDGTYGEFLSKEVVTRIFTLNSWSVHIPSYAIPFIQTFSMSFFYMLGFIIRPQKILISAQRVRRKQPLTLFEHLFYNTLFKSKLKHRNLKTALFTK